MLLSDKSAYCEFLELLGHRVVQTPSTVWVDVRRKVFQPAPPFHLQPEQAREAAQALRQAGGLVCRWFTPTPPCGTSAQASRHASLYLLRPPYDLGRIQPKARNQTRRGLERVQVRPVKFDGAMERQAFPVYADNVERLGLFEDSEQLKRRWAQWVKALTHSQCAEFWGAWEGDRLAAFSVVVFSPWGAEIVCQRSLASHLNDYPNNALVFNIATSIFQRGVDVLSYGLAEFSSTEGGLDHFKKGMAFEELSLKEHFSWHPALCFLNVVLTPDCVHAVARFVRRAKKAKRIKTSSGRVGEKGALQERSSKEPEPIVPLKVP
jgi:hypothetical protein